MLCVPFTHLFDNNLGVVSVSDVVIALVSVEPLADLAIAAADHKDLCLLVVVKTGQDYIPE